MRNNIYGFSFVLIPKKKSVLILSSLLSFHLYGVTDKVLFYRLGQLILPQIDANVNKLYEDADAEMLTDVTPVGRAAGQLYTGQNVSCV